MNDLYLHDENCPNCGTAATYQLGDNEFACKCTYELERAWQKDNETDSTLTELIKLSEDAGLYEKELADKRKAKGEEK